MGRLAQFSFFRCRKLLRIVSSRAGGIKMPCQGFYELPSTCSVHQPNSPHLAPFLGFLWGGEEKNRKTCWLFLRRVCWWCVSMTHHCWWCVNTKAWSVPFPKAASCGFHCCLQNASMYRCTVLYIGVRLKFCQAVGQDAAALCLQDFGALHFIYSINVNLRPPTQMGERQ